MSISVERFIQALATIGIVTTAEADTLAQSVPPDERAADADEFARDLVRQGRLSRFQAAAIYQDKADGLLLGNYLILDKLGAGGMGQVYRARHRRMDRVVALKVLSRRLLDSADAVARFQREAKAAARLTHPNIVTAHDADEAGGMHFLVMEYVEGSDLASLVKHHGPLPAQQALDLLLQAARGLEHAHGKGIIHRDIKPSNLLLDKDGTLKILDMGLVRMSDPMAATGAQPGADLTHSGNIMGTIDYMAPEQAMDCRQADARSDIYSLGCTLHYLLTGWPPYDGDSVLKRLTAHQQAAIPQLSSARPDISPGFDEILGQMMAKQPASRFQTSKELITALDALRNQPAVVRPVPIAVQPVVVQPVMAGAAAPGSSGVRSLESIVLPRYEDRSRRRKSTSKMPLLAAALALLLATAGTGAWMISGHKPEKLANRTKEPAAAVQTPATAKPPAVAEPKPTLEPAYETPAAALAPGTIPAKNEPAGGDALETAPLVVAAIPPDVAANKLAQASPPAAVPASSPPTATRPLADARLPVPGLDAQRESQQLLAEVYKEGYARAKQPDAKAALAEKLLNESQRAQDDATGLYVMLHEARNLAVEAANPALAERAINMLAQRYAVQPLQDLAAALDEMTGKPHPAEANRAIVDAALARIDAAQANNDFETAKRLSDVAMAAGRKAKDAALSKRAIEVGKSVTAAKQQWEAWQKAQTTLVQNPDDPSANLAVGRYLAFVQGNWDQGLARLAKGPDGPLTDLAAKSLQAPTDAAGLADLGDVWFSAAEKSKGKEKVEFRAGARYWYSQAVPELTGLMKAKIEKRLAELGGKLATPRETALRSLQVLFKDEFDDPKSGWGDTLTIPAGKSRWFGYEHGRFFINRREAGYAWVGATDRNFADFVCAVTGRVTGAPGASWGLVLRAPDQRFLIRVSVTNDQKVTIRPIVQSPMDQGVSAGPFVQPQLNIGDRFNTLAVSLRGSSLEIYANGQRVCDPVKLPGVDAVQIKCVVASDATNSISEFERIAAYALPSGEARAAEIARELSRVDVPAIAMPTVPAPPRSLQVLFKDEFDDPQSGWGNTLTIPPGKPRWFGYENGRTFITRPQPGTAWVGNSRWEAANFICAVTGRVTGSPGAGWGLALQNSDRRFFTRICVTNDQRVNVRPVNNIAQFDQGVTAGPFVQPQLNKGTGFNTLVVMLRNSKLDIYANGQRVGDPLTLPGVESVLIRGLVSGEEPNSVAEFERIATYALPPGEASAAEIARELSRADAPAIAKPTIAPPPHSSNRGQTDREVAQWVLSLGGSVALAPAAQRFDFPECIKDVAGLPAGPFPLVGINFLNNTQVTDQEMARIESLQNLAYLSCEGTSLGDETLAHAARVPSLGYLNMMNTKITDAGLAHLKGSPRIRHLNLTDANISDVGIDQICHLPALAFLSITGLQITDATIDKLRNARELTILFARGTALTSAGFMKLGEFSNLTNLGLSGTPITDADLPSLVRLTKLSGLFLKNTAVSDRGLQTLTAIPTLTLLGVEQARVTLAGIEDFRRRMPDCKVQY